MCAKCAVGDNIMEGVTMKWVITLATLMVLLIGRVGLADASTATLAWNANTDVDLAGYKIYRAVGICPVGPITTLLSSVGKVVGYTDTTVPAVDGNLCYEITAIDTIGNESIHSNRAVKALNTIPPVAPTGLSIVGVVP